MDPQAPLDTIQCFRPDIPYKQCSMAVPPLSICDVSATVNTAIYLVIRKILQSRYYFTDEENKTGSFRVVPRSQLVSGRVRSVRLQTSTLAIPFQLEAMA